MNGDNLIYFNSLRVEYIPKEIKENIDNKNIAAKIYRIQANGPMICRYFFIGFINFMLKGKGLLDYSSLFSPDKCERNNKIILEHYQ